VNKVYKIKTSKIYNFNNIQLNKLPISLRNMEIKFMVIFYMKLLTKI